MSSYHSPEGPAIYTKLPLKFQVINQEIQYCFSVAFDIVRGGTPLCVTVASVVPGHDVDPPFQEEIKPERVRRIDHMVVEEGVRVAHDDCRELTVYWRRAFLLFDFLCRYNLLAWGRKEHWVNFHFAGWGFDPEVAPVEVLLQHEPHLVQGTEDPVEEKETRSPPATAATGVDRLLHVKLELLH